MPIFKLEIKRHSLAMAGIGFLLSLFMALVVALYPSFSEEIQNMTDLFSSMAVFTDALNMDMGLMGNLIGYYGIEFEVIVGVIASLVLAYQGGNLIVKEEKNHTGESLFTLPLSRARIFIEKVLSFGLISIIFNLIIFTVALAVIKITGQTADIIDFFNLHLAMLLAHLNLGLLSLGFAELLSKRISFVGPIVVIAAYAISIIYNMAEGLDFLPYLTPYSYIVSADIIKEASLNWSRVASNFALTFCLLLLGFIRFTRRDLEQ